MSRRATTFFGRKREKATPETKLWQKVGVKRQRGWNPLRTNGAFVEVASIQGSRHIQSDCEEGMKDVGSLMKLVRPIPLTQGSY